MAAVTKGTLRVVTPAAMLDTDRGQAATDLNIGDLLVITSTAPGTGHERVYALAPVSTTQAHGVCLKSCKAGDSVSVGVDMVEIDGYSGLTAGAPLYTSASVAGGLDTTAVTSTTHVIRAVSATRVRFKNLG